VCCCCWSALPNPPTSVILTDVSADTVTLSWNSGNVEPVSHYVVQFRAKYAAAPRRGGGGARDGDEAEWRETGDVGRTSWTVRGLGAFTAYELRVLAVTGIGRSAPSATVDVTTAELGQSTVCCPWVTRSNPTHQLTDPTQPTISGTFGPCPTQPMGQSNPWTALGQSLYLVVSTSASGSLCLRRGRGR